MLQATFLSIRRKLDAADQLRHGLELDVNIGREGFVECFLYRRVLLRRQMEHGAARTVR